METQAAERQPGTLSREEKIALQEEMEERARHAVMEVISTYGFLIDTAPNSGDSREQAKRRRMFIQNTKLALQTYREVVWSLSEIPGEISEELGAPLESVSIFLDFIDATHCDRLPISQERCVNEKRLINKIKYIQFCLNKLKARPPVFINNRKSKITGEIMYRAIYYTYIDETIRTQEEILDILGVSKRTYYRWLDMGIEQLSEIMWGCSSPVLSQMIDLFDCMEEVIETSDERRTS